MTYSFAVTDELHALAMRVRTFIDDVVIPQEDALRNITHGVPEPFRQQLQEQAKQAGIFAPTAPTEFGGLGLDHRAQTIILEESGRSLLGPMAMNCSAPDEGNILLLDKIATPDQRTRYLDPLSRGATRSCFAMTEPSPGAGADPDMLTTVAHRDGASWRISGRKWFITGALGAGFAIVMARTDQQATMFLIDADNPGMKVERALDTLDTSFSGGHCVVQFDDCIVSNEAILGEPNEGFRYAQVRLGPARLTHCMRWLGAARRAHEYAVRYAAERPMFNTTLGDLGMAQQMIADNEIDIAASRAMIWRAAWALDQGAPARQETSLAKVFVAEAAFRIADRAMQLAGGSGTIADFPVQAIFREIRPFRIYDGPSEVHRWSLARRSIRNLDKGRLPGDWQ